MSHGPNQRLIIYLAIGSETGCYSRLTACAANCLVYLFNCLMGGTHLVDTHKQNDKKVAVVSLDETSVFINVRVLVLKPNASVHLSISK